MSGIFGHLGVDDRDRVFAATVGQRVIYETAMQWIADRRAELDLAMSVIVDRATEEYKLRYKLPGAGYLQLRAPDGSYGTVKATGQWDVAFPLRDYGAQVAGNDVDMAYMTIGDLDRHLMTVMSQDIATVRFLILKSILNSSGETFSDPDHGSLAVEGLADGDATLYPPIAGTDVEATENHYLGTAYAAAAISDTNDPVITMRDELLEHWGDVATGTNIGVFYHPDQEAKLSALTGWTKMSDRYIQEGDDTAVVAGRPAAHPGVLTARYEQCWMIKWRFVPTGYMLAFDFDRPAPVYERIDPADTGLPRGLNLVAVDQEFPFTGSFWRHRMGFGVANRLNGVALHLSGAGTYTTPTGYS